MIIRNIQFFCLIIAVIAISFVFADFTQADENNLVVIFTPDPLFSEGSFMPGDSTSGSAEVGNNSGAEQRIAIEAIKITNDDIDGGVKFGDALNLTIKEGADEHFNGTLTDFFNKGEFFLSDLENNASITYDFFIDFKEDSEDKYQEKHLGFDILIGIQGEEGGNGDEDTGDGSSGGGGGGLLPGLTTIINETATLITCSTATITWQTSYFSTSRVVYDTKPGQFDLYEGEQGYGYGSYTDEYDTPANTNGVTGHSITITGLESGKTYYFRCVSHASPPTIGQEHSFTTLAASESQNDPADESTENIIKSKAPAETFGIESEPQAESGIKKIAQAVVEKVVKVLGVEFEQEQASEQQPAGLEPQEKETDLKGINDLIGQQQEESKMPIGKKIILIILLILIIIIIARIAVKKKEKKLR